MVEIVCLGNEFIEGDSLAKEVGSLLTMDGHSIIDIKDSFQLMEVLHRIDNPTILDVVKGFDDVHILGIHDLKNSSSVLSAHDFDASQVMRLIDKPLKIIGIPMKGDKIEIYNKVKALL